MRACTQKEAPEAVSIGLSLFGGTDRPTENALRTVVLSLNGVTHLPCKLCRRLRARELAGT